MKHNRALRKGLGILLSLVMCLSLLPAAALAEEPVVEINETNFPDAKFRAYVSENFDKDDPKDNKLSAEEIANATRIDCYFSGISDFTGIAYFTELIYLDCGYNDLVSLDISNNTALTGLHCSYNELVSLDVSNNTALEGLDCSQNELVSLDVSNNTALKDLHCSYNNLVSLDVSNNTELTYLYCNSNYLQSLDISNNTALKDLHCGDNYLQSLDTGSNTALSYLNCYSNYLSELDVSNNTALTFLYCGFNYLAAVDVSGNTGLVYFDAEDNTYPVRLSEGRTFDLSTLPGGFDLSKASNWTGGTVKGTSLTFAPDVTEVTYDYDCGYEDSATFALIPANTVTASGLYGTDMGLEPGETYVDDYIAGHWVALQVGKRDGYILKDLSLSGIAKEDILFWIDGDTESAYRTFFFEMPDHDVAITVLWKGDGSVPAAKYTITFDPNGGTLTTGSHSATETDEYGTLNYFSAATREGYSFDGWYTEAAGGEKVTSYTKFTADAIVYAHWTPEAQTKQITEAGFALEGYALGANAEDIVVTACTEGLSLTGGYLKAKDQPYSYFIGQDTDNDGEADAPVYGPLEAGKVYMLGLRADVNAGYDVSGLTKDHVVLNSDNKAVDYGKNFDATIGCAFVLPCLTESGTTTYTVTVENAKHGDVTSSRKTASEGTTVTLTVTPDKGYTLETLTVTDKDGKEVTLTGKGSEYTFIMPASNVTVQAVFMEDNSMQNFFVDVPADAYYYDAVLWAVKNGITKGTGDTTFSPNDTCTRAQVVTFLWRAAGSPAPKSGTMPFTDVAADTYYYDAVLWAVENGITKGTGDTTFSPDDTCTRAQVVTFLWRSRKSPAADSANPFTDVAADTYYYDAVLWAVENGITQGTGDTTFSPNDTCTRAQIVTFLYRCLG
ncbi:MAG: S-layer homology domain-containing protein [Faecousia sp.]